MAFFIFFFSVIEFLLHPCFGLQTSELFIEIWNSSHRSLQTSNLDSLIIMVYANAASTLIVPEAFGLFYKTKHRTIAEFP